MNQFINKILLESKEEDIDSFFKPKNINSREEKLKEELKNLIIKVKNNVNDGLKKITNDYKNILYKDFEAYTQNDLFLKGFSNLKFITSVNKEYIQYYKKNNNEKVLYCFSLAKQKQKYCSIFILDNEKGENEDPLADVYVDFEISEEMDF